MHMNDHCMTKKSGRYKNESAVETEPKDVETNSPF